MRVAADRGRLARLADLQPLVAATKGGWRVTGIREAAISERVLLLKFVSRWGVIDAIIREPLHKGCR